MTDKELLLRIAGSDADAFDLLYDRHAAYVNGICLKFLGSPEESEEVLQEVFLQLWQAGGRYQPSWSRFTTWLYCIARNRCLDRLKGRARRSAHQPLPDDLTGAEEGGPEVHASYSERRVQVKNALAGLPTEQRRAVELCFFHGLTHREAAARLDIPLGTLKGRVKLAMTKLAVSLKDAEQRT